MIIKLDTQYEAKTQYEANFQRKATHFYDWLVTRASFTEELRGVPTGDGDVGLLNDWGEAVLSEAVELFRVGVKEISHEHLEISPLMRKIETTIKREVTHRKRREGKCKNFILS